MRNKICKHIIINLMAKKSTILFRLLSSAGTGYKYLGEKNSKYMNIKSSAG